jgi:hypothetical protein
MSRVVSTPSRRIRKSGAWRGTLAALFLTGGCAGKFPTSMTASQCGNPCAAMVCPGAFRCDVDQSCVARCEPEQNGSGIR